MKRIDLEQRNSKEKSKKRKLPLNLEKTFRVLLNKKKSFLEERFPRKKRNDYIVI